MVSVVVFVLSVLAASVSGWSSCQSGSWDAGSIRQYYSDYNCTGNSNCGVSNTQNPGSLECVSSSHDSHFYYTAVEKITDNVCYSPDNPGNGCRSSRRFWCNFTVRCTSKTEADSVNCVLNPSAPGCAQDTTFHCQNTGGSEPGGVGGTKSTATIFRQINGGVAVKTAELAGTCQDWGYCEEGVSDCEISKDSLGRNPCRRSGPEFINGYRCYYQCPDGTGLACKPVSTDYVAGATWAARCPELPSAECQPPHSSASSSPSSSPSVSSSSFKPPQDWEDPAGEGDNFNYTAILAAIHDTLHIANAQRDFIRRLDSAISFNVGTIANNVIGATSAANGINNRLSTLQQNGLKLEHSYVAKIDSSKDFLREINDYLRNDTLYSRDTSYNPLLRDIKGAIESLDEPPAGSSSSVFVRDSAFAKWWANYYADSALSRGAVGDALNKVSHVLTDERDSTRQWDCKSFNECLTVYRGVDGMRYCENAWGVTMQDCSNGGTPLDGIWNAEIGILQTLWNAVWGEDSTVIDTASALDTNVVFSPKKDTAEGWLTSAISSLFSPESTEAMLQRVERMKDSVEHAKNDTVRVQPDSLWLDSSEAAGYVQNMLLPPGTVNECWVCHAELGTFGGLVPNGLSIHVDFGNFGGFDFCAIIRAVVKIASFVVCMSLTLGSWMAAFGYNPKNDA